eukprot:Pompholyxophrys_punicea_v1_NODE_356_length_2173_cov_7.623229.p1 type:complete len:317 gc:universal NODE_356_length_2173_cov_7.623229:1318-368(-)
MTDTNNLNDFARRHSELQHDLPLLIEDLSYKNLSYKNVLPEEINFPEELDNHLSLIHLNINSLPPHWTDLLALLRSTKVRWKVIALSEIWSNNIQFPENIMNGYTLSSQRRAYMGGGVAFFVRNDLKHRARMDLNIEGCDSLLLELLDPQITVLLLYRYPNLDVRPFLYSLEDFLTRNLKGEFYLTGDMNIDLLKIKPDHPYIDLLCMFRLKNLILSPTRYSKTTQTLIDHLLVSGDPLNMITSGTIYSDLSDHNPIFMIAEALKRRPPNDRFPPRDSINLKLLSEENLDRVLVFKLDVINASWSMKQLHADSTLS